MSYFIKETKRKGDLYYQIYEGHYDKEKGYSVQTSYKVLGYLSDLKAKQILLLEFIFSVYFGC